MNIAYSTASISLVALVSLAACDKKNEPGVGMRNSTPTGDRTEVAKPAPAPDNTAKNVADGAGDTKTPIDQSQAAADIKVTADIRRAILDDKSMSMNAQNCKVITDKSGLVTLRGVVNSQMEKESIEAKAKVVAGAMKVDNQLEVKAN